MTFELENRISVNQILTAEILSGDILGKICDNLVMICVLKGNIDVTVADNVYKATENTVLFALPNEFHCIRDTADSEYAYIELNCEGADLTNRAFLIEQYSMREIMNEAFAIIVGAVNNIKLQQLYAVFQLVIIKCISNTDIKYVEADREAILFTKAAKILRENITTQLSVNDLSDTLDISLSRLKRIFAKYTLIGVHEYYTCLKIALAKELLKQGKTVTLTAELSGFSNQAYFSAAFKKITGITPKEYAGDVIAHRQIGISVKQSAATQKDLPNYLL